MRCIHPSLPTIAHSTFSASSVPRLIGSVMEMKPFFGSRI
jgi:hypothetical protein